MPFGAITHCVPLSSFESCERRYNLEHVMDFVCLDTHQHRIFCSGFHPRQWTTVPADTSGS